MKCIQLIPIQYDSSFVYSIDYYIISKVHKCYNIVSYNSSQIILFSNECRELCLDEYCLLFDNQSNRSIINIFYSQSLNYEEINSTTNNISSYDYFLLDKCGTTNPTNKILLIVIFILIAIVVILTIAVILNSQDQPKINNTEYRGFYTDVDNDHFPHIIENHNHVSLPSQPLLRKLSSTVRDTLTLNSNASGYEALEEKLSSPLVFRL
ncbi:unnamed protein product [Rotaria sp. Silwood1]|nr:unnamed protein product [Rotaria sp. Silwood1]CAF1060689.1 unnamed protein product [Rotaria sp. Silwood1]